MEEEVSRPKVHACPGQPTPAQAEARRDACHIPAAPEAPNVWGHWRRESKAGGPGNLCGPHTSLRLLRSYEKWEGDPALGRVGHEDAVILKAIVAKDSKTKAVFCHEEWPKTGTQ